MHFHSAEHQAAQERARNRSETADHHGDQPFERGPHAKHRGDLLVDREHVVLDLVVDTLGRVPRDRIVVRESPHPGLAQAAIAMAAGCRFAPARVGRKAVGKVVTMPVDFGVVRVTHGPGIP